MSVVQLILFISATCSSQSNVILDRVENSTFEQVIENSSVLLPETTEPAIAQDVKVFNNNYSKQIAQPSVNTTEQFHAGPHYEANWTFTNKETVRVTFFLFSTASELREKSLPHLKKQPLYTTMISIPSHSAIESLTSLKYYLFVIRQYKTNMQKILLMDQLNLRTSATGKDQYYFNALLLVRLNPKEKYSICIYYYRVNSSSQMADLSICIDIMHDHSKHSVHGLLFVLTQYSIILGILIVLQGLFSMRKRRLAHIFHQHFLTEKPHSLSSVSLVRQSLSSATLLPEDHPPTDLKKRIISSPAIIITAPSLDSLAEDEPFIKLSTNKNHVHFFCPDEDDDTVFIPSYPEPYSDQPDALLSMSHILDTNKPWCKHEHR